MRRNSSGQSDIGPVGCSGNFYSSRSNRTLCSPAGGFPFSKKISSLHSHVLFLLCVELNLVLVMGYCLVFIFCSANNKALAVPVFEIPLKSMGCDYWWGWWAGREEGSVTVRPVKVLPGVGRR